ncbi:MAG: hypothetical protein ACOY3Y_11805 [Acidobacteriota bacterium]
MKLRTILSVMLLAAAAPVAAQREPVAAGAAREGAEVRRDLAFERTVSARARGFDASLRPSARSKIALAVKSVIAHIAYAPGEPDPDASARQEVRARFGRLDDAESDLATFLVLAEAARCLGEPASLARQLDVGSLAEERSLRLQMAMDRRSKLIQTLSNLIQKISQTESAIVGNLK